MYGLIESKENVVKCILSSVVPRHIVEKIRFLAFAACVTERINYFDGYCKFNVFLDLCLELAFDSAIC